MGLLTYLDGSEQILEIGYRVAKYSKIPCNLPSNFWNIPNGGSLWIAQRRWSLPKIVDGLVVDSTYGDMRLDND